jgi:hypothetical protein
MELEFDMLGVVRKLVDLVYSKGSSLSVIWYFEIKIGVKKI